MEDSTRVAFVSLGCAKNTVDSEKMLGQLAEAGCLITADVSDADIVVINTCGFLQAARLEADGLIREAVEAKARGHLKRIVVAGCLVQRDKEQILDRIEGIDAIVGVNNRDDIVRAVLGSGQREPGPGADIFLCDYHPFTQLDTARLRITPRHYAYLRISEGCDQKCTFCTIPAIRGRMHCKPPGVILDEARELASDGAVEINLIGQDTTSYGLGADVFDGGLAGLLRRLDRVDGIEWIRLMYAYPSVLSDEIVDAIAECEKVCNYIDLPLQHISDRVLKAMGRRIDRAATERLLRRIRERLPDVTVRTTLIAGFPGETDEDFKELKEFIREYRFAALGVFPYSMEPDTPAGRMDKQIPEGVKQQRVEELMLAQQEIAFELAQQQVSKRFEVLVDEKVGKDMARGRHEGQAPDVDSATYIEGCRARPGQFVRVQCVGREEYDLVAKPARVR
ncbi:MAG: 30S ribosomal protein S12 methylthiotransferase RimO [Phycisphaerales bacterium]|nr:MAG: 30S ribosomal protein S12 methylthiotransferase RimO [Phycisphaerales bacterium]